MPVNEYIVTVTFYEENYYRIKAKNKKEAGSMALHSNPSKYSEVVHAKVTKIERRKCSPSLMTGKGE